MLLGGGSMCEAGGCGLQAEEGDASGCLSPPTRVLLLCLQSLQRPTLLPRSEAESSGVASLAAQSHVTCPGSRRSLEEL